MDIVISAILVGGLVLFAPLVIAIVALVRANRLQDELRQMRTVVFGLQQRGVPKLPEEPPPAEPAPAEEAPPPPPPPPTETAADAPPSPPTAPTGAGTLEQKLTSRWLVWLGGATIAIGGAFLVKYTIDEGLLGPLARVSLGFALGIALGAGGEWLRRRGLGRAVAGLAPDQVPPALTAAGLSLCFASVYAAFALYGLIGPFVTFALLAVISGGAIALSLLHGPYIAALGLAGGYAVPMMVTAQVPNAWAMFSYLLAITGGALAVVRVRAWWWLARLALAGASAWPLLWFVGAWRDGDAVSIGLYLVITTALFALVRHVQPENAAPDSESTGGVQRIIDLVRRLAAAPTTDQVTWTAGAVFSVLMFALVRMDDYGTASLLSMAALCMFSLAAARREPALDFLPVMAAMLAVAALATWHWAELARGFVIYSPDDVFRNVRQELGPGLTRFLSVSAAFAALFGAAGFVALKGARRPGLWAALSALTPVAILAAAYWRVTNFETGLAWAAAGLGLAAVYIAAAERVSRSGNAYVGALGAYAVGVLAATSLTLTMLLEQAWLTVALSLQLPALAYIHLRLGIGALRPIAVIVAVIVLVRLLLNPSALDYALNPTPIINWILYGYGIPAAAFFTAAAWFRRRRDDRLVTTLESGALLFATVLVSLEIRHWIGGGEIVRGQYELLEQSLQSIAWGAIAYARFVQWRRHGRPVALWGFRILASLAAAQVILLQVLWSNPLLTGFDVGAWAFFNVLSLAYAAPAALAVLILREALLQDDRIVGRLAGAFAFLLIFAEVTMEVRHAFQPRVMAGGGTSDGEWYSYSSAWLAYAGGLLALGILRDHAVSRYASLGLVLFTVAKVFLFDMSNLTGLYRAASFMGLGLVLVAIGALYRRYVFPQHAGTQPPGEEPQG